MHEQIVDQDGVYDPKHANDKLIFGLKGAHERGRVVDVSVTLPGGDPARRNGVRMACPLPEVVLSLKW
jgi:hypothetical protein